jgi:hemolysin activation/secretion protein
MSAFFMPTALRLPARVASAFPGSATRRPAFAQSCGRAARAPRLLLLAALVLAAFGARAATADESPEIFAARPGEERLADRLAGLRFIASPAQLADPGWPVAGLDVSRVPLLQNDGFAIIAHLFIDEPVSRESLDRLIVGVRQQAELQGRKFLSIYLPPQDITGGYVQIVVSEARSEGEVAVRGARWFSEARYRAALRQPAGQPVDAARLQDTVAWLNRNPYRHAVLAAEPGAAPGTTRLVLSVDERRPWQLDTGYDNTGTPTTAEDRVFAGVTWGDAFGRGDQLSYRYTADPRLEHSQSHSGSYTAFLPWGDTAAVYGAWSKIVSEMPEPFTQEGHSWQTGARYDRPLKKSVTGWTRSLSFMADFKYSDNNLEFATLPVTDNVTHIVQFGASFTTSRQWSARSLGLTATLYASPGGLTAYNDDAAFDGSRGGATADYVYGKLDAQFAQRLPGNLLWTVTASLQAASGPLLGTEQLNGGGAYAVRGYRESSAFGDDGMVLANELHLSAFPLAKGRDQLDPFVFVDAAWLDTQGPDADSFDLASAGVGLNYQFDRAFSLRAAYGWTLEDLPGGATPSGHGHVGANFSF